MNINEKLLEQTKNYFQYYDCDHREIEKFLNCKDNVERGKIAIDIIEEIMLVHQKGSITKHITELRRVESSTRELDQKLRDHVNHALLTFILGVYINENLLKKYNCSVDKFEWKLASLFHDIGYPLEVAEKYIIRKFELTINKMQNSISNKKVKNDFILSPRGITRLTGRRSGINLINNRIGDWELEIDARKEYMNIKKGNICHGIISALVVLKNVDLMYKENNPNRERKDIKIGDSNWNQKYFDNEVVSACTAIYIHNLKSNSFEKTKVDLLKSPLAFLLILSDSLQDWERPSSKYPNGFSPFDYDIRFDGSKIYYSAPFNRQQKIEEKDIQPSLANYNKYIEFRTSSK